ncbi:hypothetical protein ACTWM0_13840 [Pseudomonas machongensis]|uniref:hypothetical protein n=1 Tax=Pseudomonas TaxID=286 RepID=UPI0006D3F877|nr:MULTISPECIES: hypothetical protein [Pseudomonas]KAB5625204.1 hypothetical protein F7234_05230 [Pseudomonas putida]RSC26177.1 hypothetical protein EGT09_07045 [Pseudomonas putida]HEK0907227.1 hypothetical protein [Pseudomonas putida]HEK1768983.1 hypothetical protein [Pseudomonas putida]
MKTLLSLTIAALLLVGCSAIPTLPEAQARSYWKNRPVAQAVDHFGTPSEIALAPEKDWVVLIYRRDTSYVSREALGTYTGPQNGQLVHTEYWGDVVNSASCEIRVAVNRARQVDYLLTRGRCGGIKLTPSA